MCIDRDSTFSQALDEPIHPLGLRVLQTPPQRPPAKALCERLLGTFRRACRASRMPLTAKHLRHLLRAWGHHDTTGRPQRAVGPGMPPPPAARPAPRQSGRHRLAPPGRVVARSIRGSALHGLSLRPGPCGSVRRAEWTVSGWRPRGREHGWEVASGGAGWATGGAHRRWKRAFDFPILRQNANVEVNVVDPFVRKGYRFKGVASIVESGPLYEKLLAFYRERGSLHAIREIVMIQVQTAQPIDSPAYDLGLTEEEVRDRMDRYFHLLRTGNTTSDTGE